MIFAVDFDGTMCENKFPEIGVMNAEVMRGLKALKAEGHQLILWTCREGRQLAEAVKWSHQNGVDFDAVNENIDKTLDFAKRKVLADYYIDDRALPVELFLKAFEPENKTQGA